MPPQLLAAGRSVYEHRHEMGSTLTSERVTVADLAFFYKTWSGLVTKFVRRGKKYRYFISLEMLASPKLVKYHIVVVVIESCAATSNTLPQQASKFQIVTFATRWTACKRSLKLSKKLLLSFF